jgi:hypothetical protein
MMFGDSRTRVRKLVDEAMRADQAQIEGRLDAILNAVVDRIDGDPALRRQLLRDMLRSTIMSSLWKDSL